MYSASLRKLQLQESKKLQESRRLEKEVLQVERWGGKLDTPADEHDKRVEDRRSRTRTMVAVSAVNAFVSAGKRHAKKRHHALEQFHSGPEMQAKPGVFELSPPSKMRGTTVSYDLDGHVHMKRPHEERKKKQKKKKEVVVAEFWWHLPVVLKKVELDEEEYVARKFKKAVKKKKKNYGMHRDERKKREERESKHKDDLDVTEMVKAKGGAGGSGAGTSRTPKGAAAPAMPASKLAGVLKAFHSAGAAAPAAGGEITKSRSRIFEAVQRAKAKGMLATAVKGLPPE